LAIPITIGTRATERKRKISRRIGNLIAQGLVKRNTLGEWARSPLASSTLSIVYWSHNLKKTSFRHRGMTTEIDRLLLAPAKFSTNLDICTKPVRSLRTNHSKDGLNLDFLLAQLSLRTKSVLNKEPEYATYRTLVSTDRTRTTRRLASTTRTTTSKTCGMTARSNIYIGRKGDADTNQENEKKVKELHGTDLRTKPEARS
jgi:hypothetical protein